MNDEFFGLWLDSMRVYSCACFRHSDDGLDDAQLYKIHHICRKLCLD